MIPIDIPAVYNKSLEILKDMAGHGFRGRAAQIFLACKHYGNQIPRVGSPVGIESNQLQQLLDDLYSKPSRVTPEKIAIIFDADHKIPTGVTDGALAGGSNIWRNNLNLQKGFICYASTQEMLDQTFVTDSRKLCSHLRPIGTANLKASWCHLAPLGRKNEPPEYRGEDNPKMFRKDPTTGQYSVHDPQDISFYSGIIRPANGRKMPIAALIIAIYTDSFLAAGRSHIDVGDFLTDFGFSAAEAMAYFDDDPASPAHQALMLAYPRMNWTRLAPGPVVQMPSPTLPGLTPVLAPRISPVKTKTVPHPASIGITTSPPPPATSGWWDAQQAVRKTLEAAGWSVTDTTGLQVGYDFKIIKAGKLKLIEVKSSVGICTAKLTKLEYDQATAMRRDFVLAIVENFDRTLPAKIQWVEDPARLQMTQRQVVEYTLPRSVWRKHTSIVP